MKQTQRVLTHMRTYGGITPAEAMQRYGIMRLGARIYDLKRAGYRILTTRVTAQNRFGEKTSFARYSLAE